MVRELRSNIDRASRLSAKRLARQSFSSLRRRKSHLLAAIARQKQAKAYALVPVDIFSTKLSPAEALVKWLKENHRLSLTRIARTLNRDPRGIWLTYQNAKAKHPALLAPSEKPSIPLSLFKDRSRSILEHVVLYVKYEQGLSLTTISTLLRKHHSTVSTAYNRGRRKRA